MNRNLLDGNRVSQQRDHFINKCFHKGLIRQAQKAVDNGVPRTFSHPVNRSGKEYQIEGKCCIYSVTCGVYLIERCTEIERQNRLLLQKM